MQKVMISKFPKRRAETTPMRPPGQGNKITVEVNSYCTHDGGGRGAQKRMKAIRRAESEARAENWQRLSFEEQLKALPVEGAVRQRAKIAAQLVEFKARQAEAQAKAAKKAEKTQPVASNAEARRRDQGQKRR